MRFLLVLFITSSALSGPRLAYSAEEQRNEDAARSERMKHMREFVRSLAVVELKQDGYEELVPELALIYADAARDTSDSTLWLWLQDGRPRAFTAIEYYPKKPEERRWSFEFASLSPGSVVMTYDDSQEWKLRAAETTSHSLSFSTAPSVGRSRRLQQMKQLARRFRAVAVAGDSGRTELRLLPNPVYRYAAAEHKSDDGAAFVFAYGTNPEVVLLIEFAEIGDTAEWRYTLAPATASTVTVTLDGREIWDQPRFTGSDARGAYVNGLFGVERH